MFLWRYKNTFFSLDHYRSNSNRVIIIFYMFTNEYQIKKKKFIQLFLNSMKSLCFTYELLAPRLCG